MPSLIRSIVIVILPVFAGSLAGVVAGIASAGGEPQPEGHRPNGPLPVASQRAQASASGGLSDVRANALEQRLREVEGTLAAKAGEGTSPRPTLEEQAALLRQEHQELIERHYRESVDPQWANSSARSFQRELAGIG